MDNGTNAIMTINRFRTECEPTRANYTDLFALIRVPAELIQRATSTRHSCCTSRGLCLSPLVIKKVSKVHSHSISQIESSADLTRLPNRASVNLRGVLMMHLHYRDRCIDATHASNVQAPDAKFWSALPSSLFGRSQVIPKLGLRDRAITARSRP
jgi:hypothetical protein